MNNIREQTILLVDDVSENIDVLKGILEPDYIIKAATSAKKALDIAYSASPPDLILLDVMMPEMDGFKVCGLLKNNPVTRKIPVLFVTTLGEVEDESMGFAVGGVDYITKPVSPPVVRARVKTHLDLYDQNRVLEEKVKERTKELNETRLEIIRRLGYAAEYKDKETWTHTIRMSKYSQIIALGTGMPDSEAELILNASPMHDVGKIGIPDEILLKQGPLNDEEWKVMKTHSYIGYKIIGEQSSQLLRTAGIAALTHHEKWDGSGYPRGTKGEDIPIEGRICAIADVFDALTTNRPYKQSWDVDKASELILNGSGTHFDPFLVDIFMKKLPEILKVRDENRD